MAAIELLEQLGARGVSVSLDRDELVLRPGSKVPPELLAEVREHKSELITRLRRQKERHYRQKYPDEPLGPQELQEIVQRVEAKGYVLCWCEVVEDFVAFYREVKDRESIPPGFVPYSMEELSKLFAEGDKALSQNALRLIHEAKKPGGRVIG